MTDYHKKDTISQSLCHGPGHVARADAEWESIMVQITLAWVIILGYLISMGMTESRDLPKEAKILTSTERCALKSLVDRLVHLSLDRNVRSGSSCNGISNCGGFCWMVESA